MYAEHWRKLAYATFLGNLPILLVQQFCGALLNSCLLEQLLLCFQILTGCSGFLFLFSSAILLSKMKSLFYCLLSGAGIPELKNRFTDYDVIKPS